MQPCILHYKAGTVNWGGNRQTICLPTAGFSDMTILDYIPFCFVTGIGSQKCNGWLKPCLCTGCQDFP